MTTLLSCIRSHSERSEVRFSIARSSSDESLFVAQNRLTSAIISLLSSLFVVIPTERSDEGSLFVSRIPLKATL
jgi:hypothetical protein